MNDHEKQTGLGEECGIMGVYSADAAVTSHLVYYGLYALQHRGQEACGIAINDFERITLEKDLGLVGEVFDEKKLNALRGQLAVGHVRYSTTGSNTRENAQPLVARYIKGTLVVAHNGNIANVFSLRRELEHDGAVFQTTNDTEVIAFLIARERVRSRSIEEAVARVVPKLVGSFSMVIMSPKKLIAVRDPYGIRPLCMGRCEQGLVFASESCALDSIHADCIRDIRPGEIVVADSPTGEPRSLTDLCPPDPKKASLCIFEHIYFARPDSVIDGQSVYDSRIIAGRVLAREFPVEADVVIGAPDSGLVAALGYSQESGIRYGVEMIKNRYIGRTFIQPTQAMREMSVSIKLNVMKRNIAGKRVILVDDSIVRGTTMVYIVKMFRDAGAKEVHIRISSPKFLWPCYFGTDVPDRDKLIANHYTTEELTAKFGADSLAFLPVSALPELLPDSPLGFCDACFTGHYPVEIPKNADKAVFEMPFFGITKGADADDDGDNAD